MKTFLPTEFIAKHLDGEVIAKVGKNRRSIIAPVFKAARFGAPLALFLCGVIPAAATLCNQGVSKDVQIKKIHHFATLANSIGKR